MKFPPKFWLVPVADPKLVTCPTGTCNFIEYFVLKLPQTALTDVNWTSSNFDPILRLWWFVENERSQAGGWNSKRVNRYNTVISVTRCRGEVQMCEREASVARLSREVVSLA